jgi:two-component system, NarL family, response regulator DevR
MSRIRLLLADGHEIVRTGLRTLFAQSPDIEVVGEAAEASAAIAQACALNPDVILMDLRLPGGDGPAVCRDIVAQLPDTRVLFLASYRDDEAVLSVFHAGANGYLLKDIAGEALVRAVKTVASGGSVFDPHATRVLLERMRWISRNESGGAAVEAVLSEQERRVLALVAEGKTNKEVADALGLSAKTVKNYLTNIFDKLQVRRRSQAAALYSKRRY